MIFMFFTLNCHPEPFGCAQDKLVEGQGLIDRVKVPVLGKQK